MTARVIIRKTGGRWTLARSYYPANNGRGAVILEASVDFDLSTEDGVLKHARFLVKRTPLPIYYATDESCKFYTYGYMGMGEWGVIDMPADRSELLGQLVQKQKLIVDREVNLYGSRYKLLVPSE